MRDLTRVPGEAPPLVFITGASSGIGQALAQRYAQAGWRLALVARRGALMREWATAQSWPAHQWAVYEADVRHEAEVAEAARACLQAQGLPEVVIANKKSQVVMVPAREVRGLIFSNPPAIEAITSGLTERIRAQAHQRQILGIISPLQRICALLQNLSKDGKNPEVIANAPTHQEIAIMVNLTRETVTRAFQVLQSQGALARDGDDLKVDASKLKQLAEKSAD